MIDLIPTSKEALETWLVDPSGNIAVSDAGIALLDGHLHSPDTEKPILPNDAMPQS